MPRFRLLVLLLALLAGVPAAPPARAQAQAPAGGVMDAVRASDWPAAEALAARYPDPVASALVTYYRLLDPGAASAPAILAFLRANPDWPARPLLVQRWEDALTATPDDAEVARECRLRRPRSAGALLRCAQAFAATADPTATARFARRAWRAGAPAAAFPPAWQAGLTAADQWARFDALAWADRAAAAARQIPRLAPSDQPAATARLGFVRNQPDAPALYAALPAASQRDPALFLDAAWALERAGHYGRALALWRARGNAAEAAAASARRGAFWNARAALARDLLRDGPAAAPGAYFLADDPTPLAGGDAASSRFLAGFIALRSLHDPAAAARHFAALAAGSKAIITQGRAHYWLARAAAAGGNAQEAARQYAKAAEFPLTFYGQLAALHLGGVAALNARILALHDPAWTRQQVLDLAARELARAAITLVSWGAPRRAGIFLIRLADLAPDAADRSLTAHLALALGLPEPAVMISRFAGLHAIALPDAGWPIPFPPPESALPRPVVLGIIRQESSFDRAAVSSSGALGLMQLMPGTATGEARALGLPASLPRLTADPAYNMRLGSAYLAADLAHYDGCLAMAIAAYNAGTGNVDNFLAENGDPRAGQITLLDWLERIPYGETRDYVQRVIEGIDVYRAKLGRLSPDPLTACGR